MIEPTQFHQFCKKFSFVSRWAAANLYYVVWEVTGQSVFVGMGAKYVLSSFPLRSV